MNKLTTASALALIVAAGSAFGEVSSETLQSISIPDTVETSIGTLNFFDGVPTGKSWFTILRMYGPLEPWIDQSWRPGEVELAE
jgi:hypothetical protein